MENNEKAKILIAAVNAAKENGFKFLEWYQKQLNIIPSAQMPAQTRIEHMCALGIENILLFSHDFLKALINIGWKTFLKTIVVKKTPMYALWDFLVGKGILDE